MALTPNRIAKCFVHGRRPLRAAGARCLLEASADGSQMFACVMGRGQRVATESSAPPPGGSKPVDVRDGPGSGGGSKLQTML